MILPPKLTHGDNQGNLFEKFNSVIDYLREIRPVAGNGVRISRLPAGMKIESTATGTGGGVSAGEAGHPFDAQIINKGTSENPQYYVKIYNSAMPDSPYAGIVEVYEWSSPVPVTELRVTTQDNFFIVLDVTYVQGGNPPYSIVMSLNPSWDVGYLTARTYIAGGKLPSVTSRVSGDIYITGRWA